MASEAEVTVGRHEDSPLLGKPGGSRRFKESYRKVLLATLIVALGPLSFGYTVGYTSPALQELRSTLNLKLREASLFGALVNIGAVIGASIGGHIADGLGRKAALTAAGMPFVVGWLMISLAAHKGLLFIGRLLTGFGVGVVSLTVPVYIAETAPTKLRGTLGAMNQLAITTGIAVVYSIGIVTHWRQLAILGAVPAACLLLGMLIIPETPRWLATHGDPDKALSSLTWLRGHSADITTELHDIQNGGPPTQARASFRELVSPSIRKPMLVSLGLMAAQQLSGVNAVIFYSGDIFIAAGIKSAHEAAMVVAALQVVMTAVSCWLMDRAGRRVLLLVSTVGMCLACFFLGLFFYSNASATGSFEWFHGDTTALASVVLYVSAFSLGLGAIPWLMMGEIFPAHVRGLAASVATLCNWTLAFIVTQTFQQLLNWSSAGAFWIFGFICAVSTVFIVVCVPETKGRSLEQIEEYFKTS
eukprot:jgi/Chlat1/6900/Chrsp52S06583